MHQKYKLMKKFVCFSFINIKAIYKEIKQINFFSNKFTLTAFNTKDGNSAKLSVLTPPAPIGSRLQTTLKHFLLEEPGLSSSFIGIGICFLLPEHIIHTCIYTLHYLLLFSYRRYQILYLFSQYFPTV